MDLPCRSWWAEVAGWPLIGGAGVLGGASDTPCLGQMGAEVERREALWTFSSRSRLIRGAPKARLCGSPNPFVCKQMCKEQGKAGHSVQSRYYSLRTYSKVVVVRWMETDRLPLRMLALRSEMETMAEYHRP